METASFWSWWKGLLGELLLRTPHHAPSVQLCCITQRWAPSQLKAPLPLLPTSPMGRCTAEAWQEQHPAPQTSHLLPAPVFLGSWSKGKEKMTQPCMYVYPAGGMSLNMENHASRAPKKWITELTIPLDSLCSQLGNLWFLKKDAFRIFPE